MASLIAARRLCALLINLVQTVREEKAPRNLPGARGVFLRKIVTEV
jgi:hypothetical protein